MRKSIFAKMLVLPAMLATTPMASAHEHGGESKNVSEGKDAATAKSAEIIFHRDAAMEEADIPISNAVEVDGWVYLSGMLGTKSGLGMVDGGIGPETRQVMENIKGALAQRGLGMDRVVKCTVMLADMAEWPTFNGIYKEYFTGNYPARSAFAASGLAIGARVEVECMARR